MKYRPCTHSYVRKCGSSIGSTAAWSMTCGRTRSLCAQDKYMAVPSVYSWAVFALCKSATARPELWSQRGCIAHNRVQKAIDWKKNAFRQTRSMHIGKSTMEAITWAIPHPLSCIQLCSLLCAYWVLCRKQVWVYGTTHQKEPQWC